MKIRFAEYREAILPEYRGNPLIEALPPKPRDEELLDKLGYFPKHKDEERKLDAFERIEYLVRLEHLRQPLPVYIDVYRYIESALKKGYSAKNPFSPTTANYLHYPQDKRPSIEPRTGFFKPKGSGITVIGESGVGKTSMLEQILSCYDDVIEHVKYHDQLLPLKQVVWIKVDCPEDSSVRALCHKILAEIGLKLGRKPEKPATTIPTLLEQIEAKIKSGFLGILVIDEMQNLNLAKTGGADRLIAFLHNLVNNLGIPLLFCANPPFNELLEQTLKIARRAESSGYVDVELLKNDEEWELFVAELWGLQWTNIETPLTKPLSDKLYDLSVGNLDLAMRVYKEAQRQVIGSEDERINESVLEHAANITIRASKKSVDKIKRENKVLLLKRTNTKIAALNNPEEVAEKPEVTHHNKKLITIPGDLTRPHHPEFADQLNELRVSGHFIEQISDPDIIQRAAKQEDPLKYLKALELLCDEPLKDLM
ncbi:ATP-binding protein [Rheinheimera baltica]|uniref:ATP-binding protein n=1 Tax=Rheinheimera baltica TaxID=67576 RepID=A0ABT9HX32_9GAMM|nr:ATP-binding protein [Rheinheimera baltica]MDP5135679.1 ATP-binding protein [Rheinheimera baltica]